MRFSLFLCVVCCTISVCAMAPSYNDANLAAFKQFTEDYPAANVAVVTDLHDVLYERISGDIQRVRQLSFSQFAQFVWRLIPFGTQYLLHKMHLAKHPCIDQQMGPLIDRPENAPILRLMCPFRLNRQMALLYAACRYPVYACSNIGKQSYDFMNKESESCEKFLKGVQIARPDNYLQKDDPVTYQTLHATIAKTTGFPDVILMIDDKRKNVELCEQALKNNCRVFGYQFSSYDELVKSLKKHNIEFAK